MKTKLITLAAMLLIACTLNAQNKLTINVNGITDHKGHIMLGLFDKDGFMRSPVAGKTVKADAQTVTIKLDNIAAGEYAILLFQDENDNQTLDMGEMGIPTERYGFSNDVSVNTGPPTFDKCKFTVLGDTTVDVATAKFDAAELEKIKKAYAQ